MTEAQKARWIVAGALVFMGLLATYAAAVGEIHAVFAAAGPAVAIGGARWASMRQRHVTLVDETEGIRQRREALLREGVDPQEINEVGFRRSGAQQTVHRPTDGIRELC